MTVHHYKALQHCTVQHGAWMSLTYVEFLKPMNIDFRISGLIM